MTPAHKAHTTAHQSHTHHLCAPAALSAFSRTIRSYYSQGCAHVHSHIRTLVCETDTHARTRRQRAHRPLLSSVTRHHHCPSHHAWLVHGTVATTPPTITAPTHTHSCLHAVSQSSSVHSANRPTPGPVTPGVSVRCPFPRRLRTPGMHYTPTRCFMQTQPQCTPCHTPCCWTAAVAHTHSPLTCRHTAVTRCATVWLRCADVTLPAAGCC